MAVEEEEADLEEITLEVDTAVLFAYVIQACCEPAVLLSQIPSPGMTDVHYETVLTLCLPVGKVVRNMLLDGLTVV